MIFITEVLLVIIMIVILIIVMVPAQKRCTYHSVDTRSIRLVLKTSLSIIATILTLLWSS